MKTRTIAFALVALVATSAFAAPADLISAMSALDKKYIAALGLTGQPDQQAKAKVAFAAFEVAWNDFRGRYVAQPGLDAEWVDDLRMVGAAVAKAHAAILDNSDGPAAHEALEAVRMVLLASRSRQHIPYFGDYLTLFHNSMEDLINGKPAKKLVDMTAAENMSVAADLDLLIARWNKVKAMEGLLPAMSLSGSATTAYASQWQVIDTIMRNTKAALASGDEKSFSDSFGQIKPNFIKTFFLFGDFPR
ncbi:MAG TPA: hypothetical protein VMX33_09340 [bacterium]|nr:hypothetical protein [bacterium]